MLRLILAALFASACCSCEVDYDLYGKNGKPQVVVNALITPQEPFSVQLNWSGTYTGGNKFAPISGADVQLYENGKQVAQVQSDAQGVAATSFVATAGRSYRLDVSVPDYGKLTGETTVPEIPSIKLTFKQQRGWYRHFDLAMLTMPSDAKALWIRGTHTQHNSYMGTNRVTDIFGYYTSSTFVDQVNGANDTYHADEKGSTVVFEQFLRIPAENSKLIIPLRFSAYGAPEDRHTFRLITASNTYDRYMRSRYKQSLNSEWGAEGNPFVEQITVYSNISNGLGIFAGYNYTQTQKL